MQLFERCEVGCGYFMIVSLLYLGSLRLSCTVVAIGGRDEAGVYIRISRKCIGSPLCSLFSGR